MKIIITGGTGGTNVGDALFKAALNSNLKPVFVNMQSAFEASKLIKSINWHLRGRYPSRLQAFSQNIVQRCLAQQTEVLMTTGIAPISHQALSELSDRGIKKINFLTDDPWNPVLYSPWFLKALPYYDIVFSPRRDNINDLLQLGCSHVQYLPFGFNEELFYPETSITLEEKYQYDCDVIFVGGADSDRRPWINALICAGLKVNLYGAYWERYPETKSSLRGYANPRTLRLATRTAKVALCLVRKSNRDGHVMRSFEIPAIGGCMLTEDTQEHREIFGDEGKAVVYFRTIPEMVEKAQWLLNHDTERHRLAQNAHLLIAQGRHTYKDRLKTMLSLEEYHLQLQS
ncbi:hypothetical protein WA1_45230 [Scytonema hofmannii PCC 7110]|uniref:Spore protein YkvP/CgeB glycosyl transferase-like domain-containing protein n=1 Tax=Scytonema hofmannii PCC 7110 TaxID=128403 RepID=A0A139WWQ0_9CYAN|nr:glycosyltransferase [Scytonema hofmannii]KYC36866.1 hypothetical protein WA1_45230 [Scytonema hofmannii PCC 7110]